MSNRRATLNEAVDLIDSSETGAVLVLLVGAEGADALRNALLARPTRRTILWLTIDGDENPEFFSRQFAGLFDQTTHEEERTDDPLRLIERTLDAIIDSIVEYSIVVEGLGRLGDRGVRALVAYLLEFLPPTLRVVFIGAAPGVGLPRQLVRMQAQVFALDLV